MEYFAESSECIKFVSIILFLDEEGGERGYWKRGEDDCGDFNELADDFNEFVTAIQHRLDHRFVLKPSDDT